MSVPKNRRGASEMEFFHTALNLRKQITLLLLRDFGIKDKVRSTRLLSKMHGIGPEDEETLRGILEKYGMGDSVVEEYPAWLIDKLRSGMMDICRSMVMNITAANTIYANSPSEWYERRNFQNRAIGNCEQLLQEMQYVISVVPVDAEKYMPYVGIIEKEIALLKGWRKSDNRRLKQLEETEARRILEAKERIRDKETV